ncbi:MAG TPA: hypothetical protein QF764_04550 [Planctomycetota bacterium]|nr:hypothetical protein [Planctomycetota bacterium]
MNLSLSRTLGFLALSLGVLVFTAASVVRAQESEDPRPESGLPTEGVEDVANIPAVDHYAKGNEKKRYVLIGHDEEAKVPKKGYGLIVILPGGTGAIDFHGFCKRIHKHAVPEGFLSG